MTLNLVRRVSGRSVCVDVSARGEWIDVHAAEPDRFFASGRAVFRAAPRHRLPCAARPRLPSSSGRVDDGRGMGAAELQELGRIQDVPSPSVTEQRTKPTWIEVLIEMSAQRVAGALHLLRARVDRRPLVVSADSVGQPVEQPEAECLFQPLHPAHDGRRTGTQCGCGLAETQRRATTTKTRRSSHDIALEQHRPDGLLHFCSIPFRLILPPLRAPLGMLLFGSQFSPNLPQMYMVSDAVASRAAICAPQQWAARGHDLIDSREGDPQTPSGRRGRRDRTQDPRASVAARPVADRSRRGHRADIPAGAEVREGHEPRLGRTACSRSPTCSRRPVTFFYGGMGARAKKREQAQRRSCLPADQGRACG